MRTLTLILTSLAGICWSLAPHLVGAAEVDPQSVFAVASQKAAQGDASAECVLGLCYAKGGMGVDQNIVEAAKWYKKASDHGNILGTYRLGELYFKGAGVDKDIPLALKLFQNAATKGMVLAQSTLGELYYRGTGVRQDYKEAIKWFLLASQNGDGPSEQELGACYEAGTGVNKDTTEALKWYLKSANHGCRWAQYYLATLLYDGKIVDKDYSASAKWCLKAAYNGLPQAETEMGGKYLYGVGIKKDAVEGIAWLFVSSETGNAKVTSFLSELNRQEDPAIMSAARDRAKVLDQEIAENMSPSPAQPTAQTTTPTTPKESGTGAFISKDGLVLTAAHVVKNSEKIQVITSEGTFEATLVQIDASNDVALLKCIGQFTPIPIAPTQGVRVGKPVFTLGFPNIELQGFNPKLTKGDISSQTGFKDDPTQWQISVPIQPGNSGGPLCDENGNLIGIIKGTLDPIKMANMTGTIPQDVNYAVKSSYILPLLDSQKDLATLNTSTYGEKFEDVVARVQKSVVLIVAY